MSLDSNSRRGRSAAKRRRVDEDNPGQTESAAWSSPRSIEKTSESAKPSALATPEQQPNAVIRPPEAPFYPGAIELWVVRDAQGKKQLTENLAPGCRHWRIGDPNVLSCFMCNKEGDVLGCHTCKRSYHPGCVKESTPIALLSKDVFHCPVCIERGWDKQPPPEILPLTPATSRDTSPEPTRSRFTAMSPAWKKYHQELPDGRQLANLRSNRPGQKSFAAVNTIASSPAAAHQVRSVTPTTIAQPNEAKATSLMRNYDLQPPSGPSSTRQANQTERGKAGRPKSRYQTMPDEVDQALTVIYRELEGVTALRQDVAALQSQVKSTEQARKMLEGQLALELSGHASIAQKETEINSLKGNLADLKKAHDSLQQENNQLKERARSDESNNKAELEEMQSLKASLRKLLGPNE